LTSLLRSAVLAALSVGLALPGTALAQRAPESRTVLDGVDFPTGIAFGARGEMYVNERAGRVLVVEGEHDPVELADLGAEASAEKGLLGIAVPPDQERDASVYVFATDPLGLENRVVRIPLDGQSPQIVLDDLPASPYHNGGGLAFDEDGMLLVTHGEQHDSDRAQDPDVLGGKVYRIEPSGEIPRDNPFGRDSLAYAIGLRNPFGITVDPVSGAAFVTENGPEAHDEVDRIDPGGNYGWPDISGPAPDGTRPGGPGEYHDPLLDFPDTIVPTGIAVADPATAAEGFSGDLFFASYGEGAIHRVELDAAREEAESQEVFAEVGEPVIALAWGPEGLYYSTPDSIEVIPLARSRQGSPAASPSPSPTEPEPFAPVDDDPGFGPLLLLGPGLALLVVALALLLRRRRRSS